MSWFRHGKTFPLVLGETLGIGRGWVGGSELQDFSTENSEGMAQELSPGAGMLVHGENKPLGAVS